MVQLENLDVEIRAQRAGGFLGEARQPIDAKAHIAGLDYRRMAGGGLDLRLIVGRQACGADDMNYAGLRGEPGKGGGGFRGGEIEHTVNLGKDRWRVVCYGDAKRAEPSH